jgi:hypothetical protein
MTSDSKVPAPNKKSTGNTFRSERRKNTRYKIRGAAWFQWETAEGIRREGGGVTRDMSSAGVFIETSAMPVLGSPVEVVVTISAGSKEDLQVGFSGAGEVRHIQEDPPSASGFGAAVTFRTRGPA